MRGSALVDERPGFDHDLDRLAVAGPVQLEITAFALRISTLKLRLEHAEESFAGKAVVAAHRAVHRDQLLRLCVRHPHRKRILFEQKPERSLTALKVGDIDPNADAASIRGASLLDAHPPIARQMLFMRVPGQCMPGHALGEPLLLASRGFGVLSAGQTGAKDAFERSSGCESVPARSVEFRVLAIPKNQPIVLVEDGEAFRNDVQRFRQVSVGGARNRFGLLGCGLGFRKSHLGPVSLRDVLVGRDPAIPLHRPMADAHDPPVRQLDGRIRVLRNHRGAVAPDQIFLLGHLRRAADRISEIDNIVQFHAWPDDFRIKVVDFQILPIADDQALIVIKETKALRHVVERSVEALGEGCGGLLSNPCTIAFFGQAAMGLDQLDEGPEVGADHPPEQDEQQQQIDPERDHHPVSGKKQHDRDRCTGDDHRQPGRRREAA